MVLTVDQEQMLSGLDRTGLIDLSYRWPNNTVPYILSDIFSQAQKDYIELGLRELERVSCVYFVPRTTEEDFVSVEVSKVLHIFKMILYLLLYFCKTINAKYDGIRYNHNIKLKKTSSTSQNKNAFSYFKLYVCVFSCFVS